MNTTLQEIEQLGIKPKEMAEMAGVTPGMYYHVRSGKRKFSKGTRFRLLFMLAKRLNHRDRADLLRESQNIVDSLEKLI